MNTTTETTPVKPEHDYLNQIATQINESDDPLVRFVQKNQKALTYLVLALLVSIFGYRYYQDAHQSSQLRSAEMLSEVRSTFKTFGAETAKTEDAALRSFSGSVKTLEEQKYPYDLLAKQYQLLADSKSGKLTLTQVSEELAKVNWEASKNSPQAIWKEMLALNLAKQLLVDENHRAAGIAQIKKLATDSLYVQAIALIAWRSYADFHQEKSEQELVQSAIDKFKKSHPEQAELL